MQVRDSGDPVVVADELIEAFAGGRRVTVSALLRGGRGGELPAVVAELARRDVLLALLPRHGVELLRAARAGQCLAAVFRAIIDAGAYEDLCRVLPAVGGADDELLRQLADARPSYDEAAHNAAGLAAWQESAAEEYLFDALIVLGYTPLQAEQPTGVDEQPVAQQRLQLALHLYRHAMAPVLIVTGGAVHPAGTPINEALSMRAYLLQNGLTARQVLIEPYARHTTTNLRNAGRILRRAGRRRGLVISGFESPLFGQDFYLSHPLLSTFTERCRRELGYSVGELSPYGDNQTVFVPSEAVETRNLRDPWDA